MTICICPACQNDLKDIPIPEASRSHYSKGSTHFIRLSGIYDTGRDRTTSWRCPDCGHESTKRGDFENIT